MFNNKRKEMLKILKNKISDYKKYNNDNNKKSINISDIYVFPYNNRYYLVRLETEIIKMIDDWYPEYPIDGYNTKFINIFNNKILYEIDTKKQIKTKIAIDSEDNYIYKLNEIIYNTNWIHNEKLTMKNLKNIYCQLNTKDNNNIQKHLVLNRN